MLSRWLAAASAAVVLAGPALSARADDLTKLQSSLAAAPWQMLVPGVERLGVSNALSGEFAAYRLAPEMVAARVLGPLKPEGNTADEVRTASKAFLTVNGGFFFADANGRLVPTGLLIVDGAKLGGQRKCRACTAVLYTDATGLHIARPVALPARRQLNAALQVGPMLIEAGRVMSFNADGPAAPRTAICTTAGNIEVVVSIRSLTLHDLAVLLLAKRSGGGFDCEQAINLDGGSSSQLSADLPAAKDRLGYPVQVQNFVAFFLK